MTRMWQRALAKRSEAPAKAVSLLESEARSRRQEQESPEPRLALVPWPGIGRVPLFPAGAPTSVTSSGVLQAKLTVGSVDDPLEEEADQIAEKVMRMPDPVGAALASVEAGAGVTEGSTHVARKCATCEENEESVRVQRSVAPGGSQDATQAPPVVEQVLRGSGSALDAPTRAFFESRLGFDFSGVRVHTGAQAEASARAVRAHAYTVGRDIVFAEGKYAPAEGEGRRLLAHELAHVVQQRGAPSAATTPGVQRAADDGASAASDPAVPADKDAGKSSCKVNVYAQKQCGPEAPIKSCPTNTCCPALKDHFVVAKIGKDGIPVLTSFKGSCAGTPLETRTMKPDGADCGLFYEDGGEDWLFSATVSCDIPIS